MNKGIATEIDLRGRGPQRKENFDFAIKKLVKNARKNLFFLNKNTRDQIFE